MNHYEFQTCPFCNKILKDNLWSTIGYKACYCQRNKGTKFDFLVSWNISASKVHSIRYFFSDSGYSITFRFELNQVALRKDDDFSHEFVIEGIPSIEDFYDLDFIKSKMKMLLLFA